MRVAVFTRSSLLLKTYLRVTCSVSDLDITVSIFANYTVANKTSSVWRVYVFTLKRLYHNNSPSGSEFSEDREPSVPLIVNADCTLSRTVDRDFRTFLRGYVIYVGNRGYACKVHRSKRSVQRRVPVIRGRIER